MKQFLCAAVLLVGTAATGAAQDIPLSKILVEGEGWKVAAKDLPGVTHLLGRLGSVAIFHGRNLMQHEMLPDGKLVPVNQEPVYQVPFHDNTRAVYGNDYLSYCLETKNKSIVFQTLFDKAQKTIVGKVDDVITPTCLTLWPDDAQLVIGDGGGKYLWTARVEKDGNLGGLDRYYSLRVKPGEKASGVKAMVMDAGRLLYAATPLGVQVFDPTGRLAGVLLPPDKEEMTAITIGGKDANTLFVACGDKIYSRKIQGKATYTLKKDK